MELSISEVTFCLKIDKRSLLFPGKNEWDYMYYEQTTNNMLALTSFSIVSALASLPNRLENFTLEICKLKSVSNTKYKNSIRLHIVHFPLLRSQVSLMERQLGPCIRL